MTDVMEHVGSINRSTSAEAAHPMGSVEPELHLNDIWGILRSAQARTQHWVKQRAALVKELQDIRDFAGGLLFDIERETVPVEQPQPNGQAEEPIIAASRPKHHRVKKAKKQRLFKRSPAQRRAISQRVKAYWAKQAAEV